MGGSTSLGSAVKLRKVELRDINAIRAIDAQVYPRPWSKQMTIDQTMGAERIHFVAEEAGRVISHGGMAIMGDDAHVTTLAVDPLHQRRGIATAVMERLFDEAQSSGCRAITLEVRVGNDAAVALYERLGFESAGVRPLYYRREGEDALVMWRSLDE